MSTTTDGAHAADVAATFDSQFAADGAVLQLRLAGFPDDRIGAFAGRPVNMVDRHYGFLGAVIGAALGIALGRLLTPAFEGLSEAFRDVRDPFGLAAAAVIFGALLGGVAGYSVGLRVARPGVAFPAGAPTGSFTVAVAAGADDRKARALEILSHNGGRPLGAGHAAHPHHA